MNDRRSSLAAAARVAEKLKEDGNTYFSKNRFGAAIDAYTEAITLCPNVAVYWTNRAFCHRKRNDWEKVEEDCRRAIELDHSSVKGHYMLGLSLIQRKLYADGIKELDKALDLVRGTNPKRDMVEDIWQALAKAKFMQWEDYSMKRSRDLQTFKEACRTALMEKYFPDGWEREETSEYELSRRLNLMEQLERVMKRAAEDDSPTEIPDHLCCRITLDIFRDPVITPSGLSYERSVILDHLKKVGKFDPVTREPLDESQLISNLAIKEAVQAYLDKHGWAYKMT